MMPNRFIGIVKKLPSDADLGDVCVYENYIYMWENEWHMLGTIPNKSYIKDECLYIK